MNIYLVEGVTGEWEDNTTWITKAFTSKSLAEEYAKLCQDFANNRPAGVSLNDESWTSQSPDPNFQTDYTGTHYAVLTMELVTDKFMEGILNEQATN